MSKFKIFIGASVIASALSVSSQAHAVPDLGVGSSFGYINAVDKYQTYWGSNVPGSTGQDGFLIGPTGSSLHVFSSIMGADIYVLTTADVGTGNQIKFNNGIQIFSDTGTFRSYDPTPYYGINLGAVDPSKWNVLPKDPFAPGPFYSLDVNISYTKNIGPDQWIFAAADTNRLAGLQAKATDVWTESNGLPEIQKEATEVWYDTNGIPDFQHDRTKTGTPGHWVWVQADTLETYAPDTFTSYPGDDSSPKTTSARGGYEPPIPPNIVPEPGTFLLLGAGLAGLALFRRKSRD